MKRLGLTRAIALFALLAISVFVLLRPACDAEVQRLPHDVIIASSPLLADLNGQTAGSSHDRGPVCCHTLEAPSIGVQAIVASAENHFKPAPYSILPQHRAALRSFMAAGYAAIYDPLRVSTLLHLQTVRLLI